MLDSVLVVARFQALEHQALARLTLIAALGLGLPSVTAVRPVAAQTKAELDHARQLYGQGLTQEAAGDWTGALSTFQEVARIKQTPQVRFHVARCKEHLGRLNEALGGYRLAEYEAGQAGAGAAELVEEVKTARAALEERIPKLVIERGEGADTIKIELDGVALGQSEIGREVRVDPGPHVITGVLASGERFTKKVYAKERSSEQVILDVPLDLHATAPSGGGGAPPEATSEAHAAPLSPAEPSSPSVVPWIVGGVGLASLATAGVFYLRMKQVERQLDDDCIGSVCPETLKNAQDRGELDATVANITGGVGAVALGVAAVWLWSGGSSEPAAREQARSRVTVDVATHPHHLGVQVGGRF